MTGDVRLQRAIVGAVQPPSESMAGMQRSRYVQLACGATLALDMGGLGQGEGYKVVCNGQHGDNQRRHTGPHDKVS